MNTLTPRQYLVQISLKSVQCQPSAKISKAICQLHYGQSFIRFKSHPQIASNGLAVFRNESICIPYCDEMALVVRRNISSKKEVFLGHYQIQVQQYLQRKIYFIQLNERLYETQTYINFQCKIIDKERFAESQTEDLSEAETVLQKSQYSAFQEQAVNMQKLPIRDSQSQHQAIKRTPKSTPRRNPQSPSQSLVLNAQLTPPLQQQFNKKLFIVQQILKKKNLLKNQDKKLSSFDRNNRGELKSQKLDKMQKLLNTKKQQFMFNSLMIYVGIGLVSVVVGMVMGGD